MQSTVTFKVFRDKLVVKARSISSGDRDSRGVLCTLLEVRDGLIVSALLYDHVLLTHQQFDALPVVTYGRLPDGEKKEKEG